MNRNILANSVQTLKILYMVVAGLALAAGLEKLVIDKEGQFGFPDVCDSLVLWVFFLIFVSTVVRFVHGAMRHFDHYYLEEPDKRNWEHQPLWDFFFLGFEAFAFFILAFSLDNQPQFINWYLILLIADTCWIVGVFKLNLKKLLVHGTPLWWITANFVVLLPVGIPWLFCKNSATCPYWLLIIFFVTVLIHSIMDYFIPENWKFYFGGLFNSKARITSKERKASGNYNIEIIFLAGAYIGKDYNEIENNIRIAENYSIELWNRGYKVFCPHLNTCHFEVKSTADEKSYKEFDMKILETCDAIFALPNYKTSAGAVAEIKYAEEHGKPVFYSVNDLPQRK